LYIIAVFDSTLGLLVAYFASTISSASLISDAAYIRVQDFVKSIDQFSKVVHQLVIFVRCVGVVGSDISITSIASLVLADIKALFHSIITFLDAFNRVVHQFTIDQV
jgi:hypothetical protein